MILSGSVGWGEGGRPTAQAHDQLAKCLLDTSPMTHGVLFANNCDTGDSLDIEDHQLRADAREVLRAQSEAEIPAVLAAHC